MVIKRMVLVVLAVVLVCGMAVGCNKNSSLNGTWVYEDDDRQIILKLNNGNFEVLIGDMNYLKGTYSVTDGQMTFKTTAIHGSLFQGGGYVMDYVK